MVGVVVLDVDVGVLVFPDDVVVVLVDVGAGLGWAFGCGVGACPRWPAKTGAPAISTIAVTVTAVRVKRIRIPPVRRAARHVPAQQCEKGRKTEHTRPEADRIVGVLPVRHWARSAIVRASAGLRHGRQGERTRDHKKQISRGRE